MTTFKTDKPNIRYYILRNLLLWLVITSFVLIYNSVFPLRPVIKQSNYWILMVLLLISFAIEIFKRRLYEISFDSDNRVIIFKFISPVFKERRKILPFEKAGYVIMRDSSILRFLKENYTFSFMNGKFTFLELNRYKDGFSENKLKQIAQKFESLGLSVENAWV